MNKNFSKKSIMVFTIGILLVLSGILMIGSQVNKVRAATNYTLTWDITKWRNYRNGTAFAVSLGASEWSVTGTVGSTNISEKWVVNTWRESSNCQGMGDGAFASMQNNASAGAPPSSTYFARATAGQYGAVAGHESGSGVPYFCASIPTKWTVTGTIQ